MGQTPIKQDRTSKIGRIQGKKVINGGCYGDPDGAPIVLAGCITADLKVGLGFLYITGFMDCLV